MRYLDKSQKAQIGFEYILNSLELMTAPGKEMAFRSAPFGKKNKKKLDIELDNLTKIKIDLLGKKELVNKIESNFYKFNDIRNTIACLGEGYVLDEVEFFEIKHFSKLATDIKRAYDSTNIKIEEIALYDFSKLFSILDPEETKIVTFHIYEKYSDKLKELRSRKRNVEQKIFTADEDKKNILLEERLQIVIEEDEEESLIKKRLSKEVAFYKNEMLEAIVSIGKLDFYLAKAKLAERYNCSRPIITEDTQMVLEDAINPMVKDGLQKKSKKFTPISIIMDKGVSLLTGANMGGKSVTIKTIVLNVLLGQMGFYTFAKKAMMPTYDFIYYVSDDMQSVERGLSTFGAEILSLKTILSAAKVTDGFIALDELARGTNPKEGRDIVQGIVIFLKQRGSHSLISTHYDGIETDGIRHYQVIGLRNIDYEALRLKIGLSQKDSVGIIQKHMDYNLVELEDEEVPKDALNIATLLGMDREVLEIIEGFYNGEEDKNGQ